MKKKPVRKKVVKYNRGALGAGMAYAILAMLVIVGAGTTMIGNIVPGSRDGTGMPVVILSHVPDGEKSNLQLETFPGATYTPTPTPTATPTPTPPPPPPASGSGGGSGGGDGNSAPSRGNGGGGGGGGGGAGVGYNPVQELGNYLLALAGFSK